MANVIRKTYPPAFSAGLLILIYAVVFLLSEQVFKVSVHELNQNIYIGMFLVATAFMIMILILWEELLFPIKVKEVNGGMDFHNHRNKIQTQLMIYLTIPVIFIFVYFNYELNLFRFIPIAAICIFVPFLGKIGSGIKNYNDFLRITDEEVEYKDNDKGGLFKLKDIQQFTIITHEKKHNHQIELLFKDGKTEMIDLHDMELEAYYDYIYKYMKVHYRHMLKEVEMDD